jgi:hypothetical protein
MSSKTLTRGDNDGERIDPKRRRRDDPYPDLELEFKFKASHCGALDKLVDTLGAWWTQPLVWAVIHDDFALFAHAVARQITAVQPRTMVSRPSSVAFMRIGAVDGALLRARHVLHADGGVEYSFKEGDAMTFALESGTVLHWALAYGSAQMVDYLLDPAKCGANYTADVATACWVNFSLGDDNRETRTKRIKLMPLHVAILRRNVDVARRILLSVREAEDATATATATTMATTTDLPSPNRWQYQTDNGKMIDVLELAVLTECADMVRMLVDEGERAQCAPGRTCLHVAVARDNVELATLLLERGGAKRVVDSRFAGYSGTARYGEAGGWELFCGHVGVDDFMNEEVPLTLARSEAMARLLIAHGATVSASNCTALVRANVPVSRVLIAHGALVEPSCGGGQMMRYAIMRDDADKVALLLEHWRGRTNGGTLLAEFAHMTRALKPNSLAIGRMLVDAGVDVHAQMKAQTQTRQQVMQRGRFVRSEDAPTYLLSNMFLFNVAGTVYRHQMEMFTYLVRLGASTAEFVDVIRCTAHLPESMNTLAFLLADARDACRTNIESADAAALPRVLAHVVASYVFAPLAAYERLRTTQSCTSCGSVDVTYSMRRIRNANVRFRECGNVYCGLRCSVGLGSK